jgi:fluoroquinolone transport system permease protein
MSRLVTAMKGDVRLQVRNGFYWAAGFVALYTILLLSLLNAETLEWIIPPFVFSNLLMNTFYFIGGLVLLEKAEGTLEAQVVTPLRTSEYLASKIVTLTALAILENLAIVGLTFGLGVRIVPLVAGMLLAGPVYALLGFAAVARYDSINEYLFPSFIYATLLAPPLLAYFGVWDGWWIFLHPLQPALVLMEGAVRPLGAGEWAYGLLGSVAWIVPAFLWSRRAFHRFVIVKEGTR